MSLFNRTQVTQVFGLVLAPLHPPLFGRHLLREPADHLLLPHHFQRLNDQECIVLFALLSWLLHHREVGLAVAVQDPTGRAHPEAVVFTVDHGTEVAAVLEGVPQLELDGGRLVQGRFED